MGSIDYEKLYRLQDEVLNYVFEKEQEFYLTGGTCLSRFYHPKRYSDDLDFFTNNSQRFAFAVKKIKLQLAEKFTLTPEIEAKDFVRFRIDDILQVDFVNDHVPHFKDLVILENNYIIDNIENILSNKLTAVLGRDNPKDIFDIYLISLYHSFHWEEILQSAGEKANIHLEELIIRLKSFPVSLLKHIKLIDNTFLDDFQSNFPTIIDEIKKKQYHTALREY